ncbi:uncharacterized protein N7473_010617 [Penicillium subrubescens]|uniref:uncharacterized protein n=1 Tax=Penicillium subrubescens TaxID=1316194 RepID=UPI002545896D|nr:uncharacterized protein N7473_010617 [Penicillium subrubescens]KAJ5883731.1 hypothetical protein N7473_010617 [Penicillium subrubescens]
MDLLHQDHWNRLHSHSITTYFFHPVLHNSSTRKIEDCLEVSQPSSTLDPPNQSGVEGQAAGENAQGEEAPSKLG